jgi:glycerol-3-phosphate acyltransferase PlsX
VAPIVVDAMGGDHAPDEIVMGAIDAERKGIEVVLAGDEGRLRPLLEAQGADLPIAHASQVIGMADDPARALREKKDSSISVAARLVAARTAGGLVSAGSTGAAMAAAAFLIGRLPGVARPAIASFFPGRKVVLDSGANLACRADHLVQFAIMGAALAQSHFDAVPPRVGLVNIGEEAGKGRDLEKEAYDLIAGLDGIDFVGNVEGRDLARNTADVFVTDGFTGNVVLKTAEGVSGMVVALARELMDHPDHREEVHGLMPVFDRLFEQVDPEGVGGAHLLGTEGVVVIAHGSSSRIAISNAIGLAAEGVGDGLVDKISAGLAAAAPIAG